MKAATPLLLVLAAAAGLPNAAAFAPPVVRPWAAIAPAATGPRPAAPSLLPSAVPAAARTTGPLLMGYSLPPGGPPEPKNQFESVLSAIVPVVLTVLFFASPLGGIFFAVTNSLFLLALLTPLLAFGAFKVWSALNVIEAPCPSCEGFPVAVMKSGEPSVCLNCGMWNRANEKGDGVECCNAPNAINSPDGMGGAMGGSVFDSLFGANEVLDRDVFGNVSVDGDGPGDRASKAKKRQGAIIDVEVEKDWE